MALQPQAGECGFKMRCFEIFFDDTDRIHLDTSDTGCRVRPFTTSFSAGLHRYAGDSHPHSYTLSSLNLTRQRGSNALCSCIDASTLPLTCYQSKQAASPIHHHSRAQAPLTLNWFVSSIENDFSSHSPTVSSREAGPSQRDQLHHAATTPQSSMEPVYSQPRKLQTRQGRVDAEARGAR